MDAKHCVDRAYQARKKHADQLLKTLMEEYYSYEDLNDRTQYMLSLEEQISDKLSSLDDTVIEAMYKALRRMEISTFEKFKSN